MTATDRRTFLRRGAAAAGGLAVAGPLQAYSANVAMGQSTASPGYGPLRVAPGGDLMLPEGFEYRIISTQGEPMRDGKPTPGIFDGMGAFEGPDGTVVLIRNHENRSPFFPGSQDEVPVEVPDDKEYDTNGLFKGGCTKVVLDSERNRIESFAVLGGTTTNCAGGMTPWGSWITCEEVVVPDTVDAVNALFGSGTGQSDDQVVQLPDGFGDLLLGAKDHGYIFEIDASTDEAVVAVPIKPAGQFFHEAVAWLDETLYLTEDNDVTNPQDAVAFYRYRPGFVPTRAGELAERQAEGVLEAMAISGQPDKDLRTGIPVGEAMPIEWVRIDDPTPQTDTVRQEAFGKGAARLTREEGIWVGEGGRVYFDCTNGGEAEQGQIFELDVQRQSLTLIYESEDPAQLMAPDNLTVAPFGDLFLCEDAEAPQFVRGLTPEGQIYDFARSTTRQAEFCGACFSPDGQTLFFNQQGDREDETAVTYAVWGPFASRAGLAQAPAPSPEATSSPEATPSPGDGAGSSPSAGSGSEGDNGRSGRSTGTATADPGPSGRAGDALPFTGFAAGLSAGAGGLLVGLGAILRRREAQARRRDDEARAHGPDDGPAAS